MVFKTPIKIINVTSEIICKILDVEAKKFGCGVKWDNVKKDLIFIGDIGLFKYILLEVKEMFCQRDNIDNLRKDK